MNEQLEAFQDFAPYLRLILAAAVFLARDVPMENAFAVADRFIAVLRADIGK